MVYKIEVTSTALKQAKKLPKNVRKNIVKKSQVLKQNPLAGGKLKGKYSFLRSFHLSYKKTSYRVIYQISKNAKKLYIRYAGSRENLYKNLNKLKLKSLT